MSFKVMGSQRGRWSAKGVSQTIKSKIAFMGKETLITSHIMTYHADQFPFIPFINTWAEISLYHSSKFTEMTGFQMDKAQANLKETHSQIQGMLVSNSTITIDVRSKLQAIQELARSISRDVATLLNISPQLSHNPGDMNIPEVMTPSYTPLLLDLTKKADEIEAVTSYFIKPENQYTISDLDIIRELIGKFETIKTQLRNAIPKAPEQ